MPQSSHAELREIWNRWAAAFAMLVLNSTWSLADDIREIRAEICLQRRIVHDMSVRTICDFSAIDRLVLGLDGRRQLPAGGSMTHGKVCLIHPDSFKLDRTVWSGNENISSTASSRTLLTFAPEKGEGLVWDSTFKRPVQTFPRASQCVLTDDSAFLAVRSGVRIRAGAPTDPLSEIRYGEKPYDGDGCAWMGTSPHLGRKFVLVNNSSEVLLLDIEKSGSLQRVGSCKGLAEAFCIALGRTGLKLAWTDHDGVWSWDRERPNSGKLISAIQDPFDLAFGADDEVLAITCGNGDVVFVDLALPRSQVRVNISDRSPETSLAYSPKRNLFFAGTTDGQLAAIRADVKAISNPGTSTDRPSP